LLLLTNREPSRGEPVTAFLQSDAPARDCLDTLAMLQDQRKALMSTTLWDQQRTTPAHIE
jgi:hypothetical protein